MEHDHEFERLRREFMENMTRLEGRFSTAILWEREQCAKAAEAVLIGCTSAEKQLVQSIAANIRARSYTD